MYYPFWRSGGQSNFLRMLFANTPRTMVQSTAQSIAQAIKIKPSKSADYYRQNGPRECARRKRQIEAGILRVSQ